MSLNTVNDRKGEEGCDIYCASPSFRALMYEQDQTKCDYNTLLDKCELRFDSLPINYDKKHRPIDFPTYENQRNRKIHSQSLSNEVRASIFQEKELNGDFLAFMDFEKFSIGGSCLSIYKNRYLVRGSPESHGIFNNRAPERSLDLEDPGLGYEASKRDKIVDNRKKVLDIYGALPHRRHYGHSEFSSASENKENSPLKQKTQSRTDDNFEIYIEDIALGIDRRTTCMIKNIPNKYSLKMLIELLNEDHMGTYNFLYLRMDFKNRCNVGYAFVNFANCMSIISFHRKVHGKSWKRFTSNKICELTYASIQGFGRLVCKFRNSSIMQEKDSFRPKVFYTRGRRKGLERKIL